ncbi:hypothetical protein [Pontibacillus salipaludis]|uniref:hypothetical protein n=1 Tax=Pontibacillus salipaludis TaxID=1697394 RepID=UPI0031E76DF7
MSKVIQKFFIFLAIVFVTFQPILVPAVYAVESWSGDSWEGNSWEGNPWNSSELQWSGEIWEGKSTNGETWNGEGTNGNGFQGEYFNGAYWTSIPWYLEGWNAEGWNQAGFNGSGSQGTPWTNPAINGYGSTQGTPWQANGFNGGLTQGDPYAQAGFDGLGTQGNPYAQPGFVGNGTQGAPYAQPGLGLYGYGTSAPGSSSPFMYGPFSTVGDVEATGSMESGFSLEYNASKYVMKNVIGGSASLIGDLQGYETKQQLGLGGKVNYGGRFYSNLLVGGFKLGAGDNPYSQGIANAYGVGTRAYDGFMAGKDMIKAKRFTGLSEDIYSATRTMNQLDSSKTAQQIVSGARAPYGAISKLNAVSAGIGAGFAAYETWVNTDRAIDVLQSDASMSDKVSVTTDATASVGDTLMNAGMVATAIPGFQAIGLGVTAIGAGIWVASKGVKHWGSIKKAAGTAINKASDVMNSTFKTVKGWFS